MKNTNDAGKHGRTSPGSGRQAALSTPFMAGSDGVKA
jgi:hypothetical protein